ncbi:MAG: HAMP domain-containing histidine kinase [Propionibacteriaceae bacterium]|jgi:two-component system sensor histidine kinase MprB|nr:HAMP domain-containing histidine kinase [Propionibacteriaceae bacterium]
MRFLQRVIRAGMRSLRYRLVLLTALTIILGAAITGVGTYQAARVSLYNQLDLGLLALADQMARDLRESTVSELQGSWSANLGSATENVVVMLVAANTNKSVLIGEENMERLIAAPELLVARVQSGISKRDERFETGVEYRVIAVPFVEETTGDGYALVVARDLSPTTAGLSSLATMQWMIGLTAISLSVMAAVFVAHTTLRPIRQLTEVLSEITATDQLTTIEVEGTSEVAELERSFNSMMESLSGSRKQQTRLIADAGHELRTPLTSLRTNIELLIADESSKMLPEGARSEIYSDVAAQLGEFTSLINDLVLLARDDVMPSSLMALDLSVVVTRAVARAKRRGPALNVAVRVNPYYVMGDAVSLERAVTNLLDNAVKFSPAGGTIWVSLDSTGLCIEDEGPGIAQEDVPHIFERFFRSDSSRNEPGTGLGLSIVDHTITAHHGTIELSRARSGGAKFTVQLPQVDPDEVE